MLLVLRNEQGCLEAAMECQVVNAQGQLDPKGKSVWVEQLELSQGVNGRKAMRYFIEMFAELLPWTTMAYWQRRDRCDGRIRYRSRAQLLREEVMV